MGSAGAALIAVDLLLKIWASTALADRPIALPGPVDLQLAHNSGIAFGRFGDVPPAAIITVTLLVTIGLWVAAAMGALPMVPTVLVASGASANVLDRFEAGSVVDLLHTGWWPTFNPADVYISVGVVLLLLASLQDAPPRGDRSAVAP